MDNTWRYWKFVRLDAAGKTRLSLVIEIQNFFQQQFPQLSVDVAVPDLAIQRRLMQILRSPAPPQERQMAEASLRCFISHRIVQACGDLERQYGETLGFRQSDLLPLVLNDVEIMKPLTLSNSSASTYPTLAAKILQTFDPAKSNLSTWTRRLVEHDKALNTVLMEYGLYLMSDWALLNATSTRQIQRRLANQLTASEVQAFCILLKGYHTVYRRDRRLDHKQAGQKCAAPTLDQLQQIADYLKTHELTYSSQQILQALRSLAQRLRQTRQQRTQVLDEQQVDQRTATRLDTEETDVLLNTYFQELSECLDQAIDRTMADHLSYHRKRKPPTDEKFLKALCLFYCEFQSMGEIARAIDLEKQYQVTRLIRRKTLQEDVQRNTIEMMANHARICSKITEYINLARLESLNQELKTALDRMIAEADAEATTPNRSSNTLFSSRMCRYLSRCFSAS